MTSSTYKPYYTPEETSVLREKYQKLQGQTDSAKSELDHAEEGMRRQKEKMSELLTYAIQGYMAINDGQDFSQKKNSFTALADKAFYKIDHGCDVHSLFERQRKS